MDVWLAADQPFFGGAGVRTQTIVGTAAALILLVCKYGFSDVLQDGLVVVDPSVSPPRSFRASAFSVQASSSSAAARCTG